MTNCRPPISSRGGDGRKHSRDGTTYAVTEKFGYNTISYNADKVDPADMQDLATVWSDKYAGRISIYDYYLPVMGLAAIAEGVATADIDSAALDTLGPVLSQMRSSAASVAGVVAAQTALATGEVDIVVGGGRMADGGVGRGAARADMDHPRSGRGAVDPVHRCASGQRATRSCAGVREVYH